MALIEGPTSRRVLRPLDRFRCDFSRFNWSDGSKDSNKRWWMSTDVVTSSKTLQYDTFSIEGKGTEQATFRPVLRPLDASSRYVLPDFFELPGFLEVHRC